MSDFFEKRALNVLLSLDPILPFWLFMTGLVVGSFLNVVIYRLPRGFLLTLPSRSCCTNCVRKLDWFENIPVLSYLILGGKCRTCKTPISYRYPFIEILTAILFYSLYRYFGFHMITLFYAFFVASLLAITFIDLDFRIIPDEVSIYGTVVALAWAVFVPEVGWVRSLSGAALGFFIFWFMGFVYERVTKREGLGFGDVKLMAFIGAVLGPRGAVGTIVLSSFVGSIIGIALMIKQKKDMKMALPFGPFLALGALIFLFWGDYLSLKFLFFGDSA